MMGKRKFALILVILLGGITVSSLMAWWTSPRPMNATAINSYELNDGTRTGPSRPIDVDHASVPSATTPSALEYCAARALTEVEVNAGILPEVEACFGSINEVLKFISQQTGVQLEEEEINQWIVLSLEGKTTAATGSNVLIGIDYDGEYYAGSQLYWYVNDYNGCYAGGYWYAPQMPWGWDNRPSSAIGLSGCQNYEHYQADWFEGSKHTCTCPYMDVMNNATSSEVWRP